jgi:Domain of unknown function (DUF4410)
MAIHYNLNQVNRLDQMTRPFTSKSNEFPATLRRKLAVMISCLLAIFAAADCARADITNRETLVNGPLPQPAQIWVYDFAATPADLPTDSALAGQPDLDTTPQTPDQIAEGRKLGAEIAAELVQRIHDMRMPAQEVLSGTQAQPQVNDLVIRGYLVSVIEGSAKKRFGIGFGAGASELKTAVEGFQMTANGLRKLGSGTVDAKGRKTPGASAGVASLLVTHNPAGLIISSGIKVYGEKSGNSTVEGRAEQTAKEIADALKQRFQQQGWIN